jgi:hypothetical protein
MVPDFDDLAQREKSDPRHFRTVGGGRVQRCEPSVLDTWPIGQSHLVGQRDPRPRNWAAS